MTEGRGFSWNTRTLVLGDLGAKGGNDQSEGWEQGSWPFAAGGLVKRGRLSPGLSRDDSALISPKK